MIFLLNIPIQIMGYMMLPNGARVIMRSVVIIMIFSFARRQYQLRWFRQAASAMTACSMRSSAGLPAALALALIYRAGATFGGTSTLALILQRRFGFPMSTTFPRHRYCYFALGQGWFMVGKERYMRQLRYLLPEWLTDYVLEGPSVIRTAMIITDKPDEIADAGSPLTCSAALPLAGESKGQYSGVERTMLYVTDRPLSSRMTLKRRCISRVDPNAFMVIGMGHAAYGAGFRSARSRARM